MPKKFDVFGEAEEEVISWEQAKGELRAEGVDV